MNLEAWIGMFTANMAANIVAVIIMLLICWLWFEHIKKT